MEDRRPSNVKYERFGIQGVTSKVSGLICWFIYYQ